MKTSFYLYISELQDCLKRLERGVSADQLWKQLRMRKPNALFHSMNDDEAWASDISKAVATESATMFILRTIEDNYGKNGVIYSAINEELYRCFIEEDNENLVRYGKYIGRFNPEGDTNELD